MSFKFKIKFPKIDFGKFGKDIQQALKKIDSHLLLKFEPGTITMRNSLLLVTKLNLFNIAERMNQGIQKGAWGKKGAR